MPPGPDARFLSRAPAAALRPLVKRIAVVESVAAHDDVHLPDTGLVAAFGFRGECRLYGGAPAPRAAITGLWDTARGHAHSRDHAVVIVAFTPLGAAAWLREPLDAFANATGDLDAVLGRAAGLDALHARLVDAPDHAQRMHLVEAMLLAGIGGTRPDPQTAAAVAAIERAHGNVRIEPLARELGLSQSALERRFRRHVGAPPRRFASLVRLRHVLRLHAAGADLTTVAHAAGYCDQSHFNKDFRRITGSAPGAYFTRAAA